MGEVLKAEALVRKKQGYNKLLWLIILTVLAGVVGGWVVYRLLKGWARKSEVKEGLLSSNCGRSRGKGKMGLGKAAFLAGLCGTTGVKAYACISQGFASHNQYFISTNRGLPSSPAVYGVIHGWLGDCEDVHPCYPSCYSDGNGVTSCHDICSTAIDVMRKPRRYV
jgi:hypothetical protein